MKSHVRKTSSFSLWRCFRYKSKLDEDNVNEVMHQSIESPGGEGAGNGRAMSGLSCLVQQNAAPQDGDIIN